MNSVKVSTANAQHIHAHTQKTEHELNEFLIGAEHLLSI